MFHKFLFVLYSVCLIVGGAFITLYLVMHMLLFTEYYMMWVYMVGVPLSMLFLITLFWCHTRTSVASERLYLLSSIWVGGVISLFFVALVLLAITPIFGFTHNWEAGLIAFWGGIIGINIYGLYQSFFPSITTYSIKLPGKHTWKGKNIVVVSDMHYGSIYKQKHARRLVHEINTLDASIVLIPGDFFDGTQADFTSIASEFKTIQAPHGVVYSPGNHEEYKNTSDMMEALQQANIQVLDNKKITIEGIDFIGVDYHSTEDENGLEKQLQKLDIQNTRPNILLRHKPTLHDVVQKYPIHLMLSGHSHFGQLPPLMFLALFVYGKYAYGKNTDAHLTSITSSGVGTWGPPQRIGTRAEIVLLEIE